MRKRKENLTAEQKRLDTDLWIIVLATLLVLGIYFVFQNQIYTVSKNTNIHLLLRILILAFFQFGLAGLGISIVLMNRKESFQSHGLRLKGALPSIVLSVLCFIPYILFLIVTKQATDYLPFQAVWLTEELLLSHFPVNMAGMLIVATAWGFFEGFNYVVISDKLNQRYPSKNKWLNWGAITCTIMCLFIHGIIGVTPEGFIEMITVIIIIYGMLMVKELTGNAWGCIFIFIFLWNAF